MRLNLGIIEKYHNALAGTFFLFLLYRDTSHSGQLSKSS